MPIELIEFHGFDICHTEGRRDPCVIENIRVSRFLDGPKAEGGEGNPIYFIIKINILQGILSVLLIERSKEMRLDCRNVIKGLGKLQRD